MICYAAAKAVVGKVSSSVRALPPPADEAVDQKERNLCESGVAAAAIHAQGKNERGAKWRPRPKKKAHSEKHEWLEGTSCYN